MARAPTGRNKGPFSSSSARSRPGVTPRSPLESMSKRPARTSRKTRSSPRDRSQSVGMHGSIGDRPPKTTQSEDQQPQAGGRGEVESLTPAEEPRAQYADMTPLTPPLSRPHPAPMSELQLKHRLANLGFTAFVLVLCLVGWLAVTGRPVEAGIAGLLSLLVRPFFDFLAKLVGQPVPEKPGE